RAPTTCRSRRAIRSSRTSPPAGSSTGSGMCLCPGARAPDEPAELAAGPPGRRRHPRADASHHRILPAVRSRLADRGADRHLGGRASAMTDAIKAWAGVALAVVLAAALGFGYWLGWSVRDHKTAKQAAKAAADAVKVVQKQEAITEQV